MDNTYALQDGPDFYIYDAGHDDEPREVVNSPFQFKDGDMSEARRAREWFIAEHPDIDVI